MVSFGIEVDTDNGIVKIPLRDILEALPLDKDTRELVLAFLTKNAKPKRMGRSIGLTPKKPTRDDWIPDME